jgi:hypothetical protein
MYSTVTVYRSSCTVPLLYIGLHVQYRYCISVFMYSTVTVYRSSCSVPLLYIGLHVQYRYCISVFMYSTATVYRSSCTVALLYIGLHVQYRYCISVFMYSTRYSYQVLMKLEFSRQVFEKYSTIKCHENPSSVSRFIPCERTDIQTDMTKLTVAFRNFANASKN